MNLSRYLLWRTTLLRASGAASVEPESGKGLAAQVMREHQIIQRALMAPEAETVAADPEVVAAAMADFARRHGDQESFLVALARSGLDEAGLKESIAAELRAGLVLERIGQVTVAEEAVRSFYERRRREFVIPERRSARHILITITEELEESRRDRVMHRLRDVQQKFETGAAFDDLALRFSECPSAMDGGRLGEIRRGQLYPALDSALFSMSPGEARLIESPLGLHLLLCETVVPPQPLDYQTAAPSIRRRLEQLARERALKAWLKGDGEGSVAAPLPLSH